MLGDMGMLFAVNPNRHRSCMGASKEVAGTDQLAPHFL